MIEDYIREVPDFPKPGIIFKDITPLLQEPQAMKEAVRQLHQQIPEGIIHKVVGIESRGFIFGPLLADMLGAGFVPVRKPGKLPYKKYSTSYQLEYGTDTLEIHQDAIRKGENVLIHDDLLATGGTAQAACKLVELVGGKVVQMSFLLELSYLRGRDKLTRQEVSALIVY